VINHYDSCLNLSLADQEKADLVEFLKSLPQPKN
jgi:cytochrome c1